MLGFAQKYLPTSKLSGIGYARLYTLTLTMNLLSKYEVIE